MLRGARQVGKTWAIREFARTEYEHFVEINLEEQTVYRDFFTAGLAPYDIIEKISNYFDIPVLPVKTLIFIDEIQLCQEAIQSLRFFFEKAPDYHVIGAGSLLEFELEKISIPVGRIQFLYMYPLCFTEFLAAGDYAHLTKNLKQAAIEKTSAPTHLKLQEQLRDYTLVGGMPEAVSVFLKTRQLSFVQQVQENILATYKRDFNKYAKRNQIENLDQVFQAIPKHLGRKFVYSKINPHLRAQTLEKALRLLELAGICKRVYHTSANGLPLGAEKDSKKFKVIFLDIGLSLRLLDLNVRSLFLNPDPMLINEGAIAEAFVGQEILAHSPPELEAQLYYWHREAKASNAEIDYVVAHKHEVVPIEVKAGQSGTLRSLHLFMNEKNSRRGVRFYSNQAQLHEMGKIDSLPLYTVSGFFDS